MGSATISVHDNLSISPATRVVTTLSSAAGIGHFFIPVGGKPPYTFSLVNGPGSMSTAGKYSPPIDSSTLARTALVRVTDADGEFRDGTVYVQPILQALPSSSPTIAAGSQLRLDGLGGTCPYIFSQVSGGGHLLEIASVQSNYAQSNVACNAAYYFAPTTAQTAVVRLTDINNVSQDITITTTGSSTSVGVNTLTVTPVTRVVATATTTQTNPLPVAYTTTPAGGVPPYSYSLVSGPGTVNTTTGIYSPPTDSSTTMRVAIVRVTDQLGAYRDSINYVQPTLDILTTPIPPSNTASPAAVALYPNFKLPSTTRTRTLATNNQVRIDGYGGVCPYTYTISSGSGDLTQVTFANNNFAQNAGACTYGLFTAPSTSGTSVVRVTDSQGNSTEATITVTSTAYGAVDTTYGSNGYFTFSFDNTNDIATRAALDASGNLVIVAESYNSSTLKREFGIARVTTSGTLDTTFGGLGSLSSGLSRFALGSTHDTPTGVVIQSDNKIVVGGHCHNGSGTVFDFCVARLNSSGSALDTAGYNNPNGFKIFNAVAGALNDYGQNLLLQSDGKVVMVGNCLTATTYDFCSARLTTAGVLDVTYDADGIFNSTRTTQDFVNGAALNSSNELYISGLAGSDFNMIKVSNVGALATSFGVNGILTFSGLSFGTSTEAAFNCKLSTLNRLVCGGSASANTMTYNMYASRLNEDGQLDDTFGLEGRTTYPLSVYTGNGQMTTTDLTKDVVPLSNRKMLVMGRSLGNDNEYKMSLFRIKENGVIDHDFGSSGRALFGHYGHAYFPVTTLVQADGKILIVSSVSTDGTGNKIVVVRVNP